jgi:hypothetical protein
MLYLICGKEAISMKWFDDVFKAGMAKGLVMGLLADGAVVYAAAQIVSVL